MTQAITAAMKTNYIEQSLFYSQDKLVYRLK